MEGDSNTEENTRTLLKSNTFAEYLANVNNKKI